MEVCRVEPLLMAQGTSGQPTDGGQKPCEFVSSASLQAKGGRTEGRGGTGVSGLILFTPSAVLKLFHIFQREGWIS